MRVPSPRSIRIRLTVVMTALYGGLLIIYAVLMAFLLHWYLRHSLDAALKEEIEMAQQLLWNGGEERIPDDVHQGDVARMERHLELWTAAGSLMYRSGTLRGAALGGAPGPSDLSGAVGIGSVGLNDGLQWRVAGVAFTRPGGRVFLRLAVSEEPFHEDIRNGLTIIGMGIIPGLLVIAVFGYGLAYRALRPVDVLTATANRISAKNLSERLPVANPGDELGRLALTLNDLLNRVERAFDNLRRFTADASHELRTPLTAMRSVGEVGLHGTHAPAEYRDVIGSMLEENARLTHLVDSLLFLSRAETGENRVEIREVRMYPLLTGAVETIGVLAAEKAQPVFIECSPDVAALAEEGLLRQAVINLMDNAVKFSPAGSSITLRVSTPEAGTVFLDVIDLGPGIPAADRTRVFERFYRVPTSSRRERGSGLGLAIVRWSVEAMGGTVEVKPDRAPGTTMRIILPAPSPSS